MARGEQSFTLTAAARDDLQAIWDYTVQMWSVAQADRYVGELTDTFALIASMPLMARERVEFTPPVRIHTHAKHLIIYIVVNRGIEILRILGGQQDWMSILNDTEQ